MFSLTPYYFGRKFPSISRSFDEMEKRFFDSFARSDLMPVFNADITDQGDSYRLEADLPGFAKEDIHLDLNGDLLTLSAERRSEYEDEDKKGSYICCERSYGSFKRSFDVSAIDKENIRAKLENGVLTLTLPKKPEKVPVQKQLEIE